MQTDTATIRKMLSEDFTEAMIRIGLIAVVIVACVWVFAPFAGLGSSFNSHISYLVSLYCYDRLIRLDR